MFKKYFNVTPGFSDHTRDYFASTLAVAVGAKIIEKMPTSQIYCHQGIENVRKAMAVFNMKMKRRPRRHQQAICGSQS